MKRVLIAAAVVSALAAPQVYAQAKNFEGWSLGAQLEADRGSVSATDGTSDDKNSVGLGLQARYDWALDSNVLLGLGVTYQTGNRQAGTYASGAGVYTSNRYSLDLMPGYALTDDLLLFGKLSALSTSAAADDGSGNITVQGVGYGVGLRGLATRNTYWQLGLDGYRYNDANFDSGTSASIKGAVLSVGVGYKF